MIIFSMFIFYSDLFETEKYKRYINIIIIIIVIIIIIIKQGNEIIFSYSSLFNCFIVDTLGKILKALSNNQLAMSYKLTQNF